MAESNPQRAEALAKQLKDSLAQRRPRPWKLVLAVLIVCSLILAGLVWWLYPRGNAASLEIVALDDVFTPDETPMARAQLFAPPEEDGPRRLGRQKIVFHEQFMPWPGGEKPREIIEISDDDGRASAEWPTPKAEVIEFTARFISTDPRPKNVNDSGRLFVWPKNSRLLIVDADEILIAEKLDEQAAGTLTKAAADGWRIIYLTPAATNAHAWRIARGWIQRQERLPIGPILGRRQFPSEQPTGEARQALLQRLRKFDGPKLAVAKTPVVIGEGFVPIATWGEAAERLK